MSNATNPLLADLETAYAALLAQVDQAYAKAYYAISAAIDEKSAEQSAALDCAYNRGTVEAAISTLHASAQADADKIAQRENADDSQPDTTGGTNADGGRPDDLGASPLG